jgi:hypothetical protein
MEWYWEGPRYADRQEAGLVLAQRLTALDLGLGDILWFSWFDCGPVPRVSSLRSEGSG